jgi:ketosteroid isomerase-like protein
VEVLVNRKRFLLAAAPLIIAAAPSWKSEALASAARSIDKANDEWTRAIVTGDADVLSAPYDERGVFIGPDGSAVRGKAAVRDMYAKRPSNVRILKATIRSDGRAAADPDDVYEWGTATMQIQRGDKVREASGRYLTVWHHEGATWRITHNIAF